jgi:alpha-glucosidase (family GH31 glycosyl hydrolase)
MGRRLLALTTTTITTVTNRTESRYVDATGHSPMMPKWAAGYWHSPMGKPSFSQSMVIDAVDGLVARGIPTDVYVIDYFNWAEMGDYTFNPKYWPDPAGMVEHLASDEFLFFSLPFSSIFLLANSTRSQLFRGEKTAS